MSDFEKLRGDLGATVRDMENGLNWNDRALERAAVQRFWKIIAQNRSLAAPGLHDREDRC